MTNYCPGFDVFYPLKSSLTECRCKVNEDDVRSWEKVSSVGTNQECSNSWISRVFFLN